MFVLFYYFRKLFLPVVRKLDWQEIKISGRKPARMYRKRNDETRTERVESVTLWLALGPDKDFTHQTTQQIVRNNQAETAIQREPGTGACYPGEALRN